MTPAQMTEHGSIILTADEAQSVIDALDYAANDYAYRADPKVADANMDEDEVRDEYQRQADGLSKLADRLRARRDGEAV